MKEYKNKLKFYILLATYIIILAYVFLNISTVWSFLGKILGILGPFLLGIAIAFVLNIPMRIIETKVLIHLDKSNKHKVVSSLKRPIAIVLTLLLIAGLLATLIVFVIPQLVSSLSTLVDSVPGYIKSFEELISKNIGFIPGLDNIWQHIISTWQDIFGFLGHYLGLTLNHLFNITVSITSGVIDFCLALVFSIYMLANKEKLIHNLKKLLYAHLNKEHANKVLNVGRLANKTFQSFIGGQCTEAVIIGTLCFIGMLILRLPYALLIGFVVGVTSLIPIFGAFIGTIPSALIIFMINPFKAIVFVIFIIVLQQFEGHLIYPKVVGNSIGLSAIWVMFAMLVGGSVLGFLGLLLGIPLFAVLYKLFRDNINSKLKKKGLSDVDISNE